MRDPRIDPRPGDVVARGNIRRKVVNVNGDAVWYRIENPVMFDVLSCLIGEWRFETKQAEVLHVAD